MKKIKLLDKTKLLPNTFGVIKDTNANITTFVSIEGEELLPVQGGADFDGDMAIIKTHNKEFIGEIIGEEKSYIETTDEDIEAIGLEFEATRKEEEEILNGTL